MGITMTMTGRSGKPGRPSFFPIMAHLLTTCEAGGGIPPFGRAVRSARRIALSAESARQYRRACGLRSSLPVRLAAGFRLICIFAANRCPCLGTTCHPPAKTLPRTNPSDMFGSFLAEMDDASPAPSIFFCLGKRNKTAPCRGQKGSERLWRSITWKQRS